MIVEMKKKLILASASPRRAALLKQMGIEDFKVVSVNADETIFKRETPKMVVERLANAKALKASEKYKGAFILAADTVVSLGRRVLGKPESPEEAYEFLDLLSGNRHTVLTHLTLIRPDQKVINRLSQTRLKFKALTEGEKKDYVRSKEWVDKAGGYAIQGEAAKFIPWINGCYYNVMGLPIHEVYKLLLGNGFFNDMPSV